ncbi:MAG: Uncharacterized protein F082_185 [bacterium F082]|nr:MAG: Uncharacterized protein F082_185 [bacterium F082]KWW30879.1 MAG: Uncharacterized protein AUK64_513 [bacterium P201]
MEYVIKELTIEDLHRLIAEKKVDLQPPYQRNFIWGKKDQQQLIDSIIKGYPLPTFFLYRKDNGMYEMVDGQQRAETICRFIKGVTTDSEKRFYKDIQTDLFNSYRLNITEIYNIDADKGEDIAAFYTLVNKQGWHLNDSEINKAQYADTPIMNTIEQLLNTEEMSQLDLFKTRTKSRMNDRALVEELVAYLRSGFYDKREAVEEMFEDDLSNGEIQELQSSFMSIIKRITMLNEIYPINETRYRQRSDFFTLFSFINAHNDISDETLKHQYNILVWLDKTGIIRPSNENCDLLFKYALNCVSQSNSKNAREKRFEIFNVILCHKKDDFIAEYEQMMMYLKTTFENISQKTVGNYYLLDVSLSN